jgi:hypothetical protein
LSYPDPKIKILNEAQRPSQTTHRSRRMIKAREHRLSGNSSVTRLSSAVQERE